MEGIHMNSTSLIESYNHSHVCSSCSRHDIYSLRSYFPVVMYVICGIGLPLTLVAIYALYSQVRKDDVAPIYTINLLISDLIQFCSTIAFVAPFETPVIEITSRLAHTYSLFVSVCFMVCIALERYLVIACPLWYRLRRNIKTSVVVCVLVWVITLVAMMILVVALFILHEWRIIQIIFLIFFFLPFPLFIFLPFATLKALSASISVSSDEKRRIVAILVLVLLIYSLLFLPLIFDLLLKNTGRTFSFLTSVLIRLSPLADLLLYIFMRKGTIDRLLASICCCRMDSNETDISSSV